MSQPTNRELCASVRHAIDMEATKEFKSAISELRRLRDLRTTWVGVYENNLRKLLIEYLADYS